jgi:LAO/AO transport system kinase
MVLTPAMGDEVQMMKAGILEAADIFVINKADKEGTDNLKSSLEIMLNMKTYAPSAWQPRIVLTEAIFNTGTEQLAEEIHRHREFLASSGRLEERRKERAELELSWALEGYIRKYIEEVYKDYLAKLVDDLVNRKTSPHLAAAKIIDLSRKAEKLPDSHEF